MKEYEKFLANKSYKELKLEAIKSIGVNPKYGLAYSILALAESINTSDLRTKEES